MVLRFQGTFWDKLRVGQEVQGDQLVQPARGYILGEPAEAWTGSAESKI